MNRILKYCILLTILLSACIHYYSPSKSTSSHLELIDLKDDSLTNAKILVYKRSLDTQMKEVIAVCDCTLTKNGMESTLANFVMLAIEHFCEENYPHLKNKIIPMVNRGGLRTNLNKGEIRIESIYELMPFDNEIVFLTISSTKFKESLDVFCENGKLFNSHISFNIIEKKPFNILIYNEKFDDKNQYLIATTDYLANGGDNSAFFENPILSQSTGIKLRDAIIEYCRFLTKNNKHILPYTNGRISISK